MASGRTSTTVAVNACRYAADRYSNSVFTRPVWQPRRRVSTMFDVVVIVDWSGSSTPRLGKDSIWSCVHDVVSGDAPVVNHPTRRGARDHLADVLSGLAGRRVLIGFDFSYAYPAGMAAAAGLTGSP